MRILIRLTNSFKREISLGILPPISTNYYSSQGLAKILGNGRHSTALSGGQSLD